MGSKLAIFLNQPKKRGLTIILALLGTVTPLVGLHKFYLGQPLWGLMYFILSWQTPIPRIASAIDLAWYLAQDREQFDLRFNHCLEDVLPQTKFEPQQVGAMAKALRELEQLRQDGLITEYEFEQKRRKLVDNLS
jgi:TM2 domain-containing membrane protein YozV